MNEPSASSFYVVLLFILRCFIPLAILFGISYLLRRMGLVAPEKTEPKEEAVEIATEDRGNPVPFQKLTRQTQSKKPPKKKVARKKPAAKAKTGNSRSRSK